MGCPAGHRHRKAGTVRWTTEAMVSSSNVPCPAPRAVPARPGDSYSTRLGERGTVMRSDNYMVDR